MDALLDEPFVGQLVGRTNVPQDRRRGHANVLEHELRVTVGERVHVVGIVLDAEAGRVVVDQEQGRQAAVAIDHVAVEDHEVRVVRPGDEPLLAVEDVVAAGRVPDGGGLQGPRVGARRVLGDRIAARALAAHRWVEIAGFLRRVAMDEGVVRPGDVGPQAAGPLPQLLMDQHLVHRRPALPTQRHRERTAMQSRLDRGPPDRRAPVARHVPTGLLEFDLARLEDLADEGASARLEFELGRRQGQVHAAKDASRRCASTDGVAGRGTRVGRRTGVQGGARAPYRITSGGAWKHIVAQSGPVTVSVRRRHRAAMQHPAGRCTLAPDEETPGKAPARATAGSRLRRHSPRSTPATEPMAIVRRAPDIAASR